MGRATYDLTDQRMLVVGSLGGIGSAIATRCIGSGASVAGWDIQPTLSGAGDHHAIQVDLTDEQAVATAMVDTIERLGSIDAVVIASGTMGRGWLHQTDPAEWHRVIDANLTAPYLVLRAALPHMFEMGGIVVTIGSTASTVITGGGTSASYAASKAGLLHLTRQVAVDYASYGIRANCVCPGWIDTPFNSRSQDAAGAAWTEERLPRTDFPAPLAGPGDTRQVAGTVAFLLSDDAAHINGAAVMVDGGYTAL